MITDNHDPIGLAPIRAVLSGAGLTGVLAAVGFFSFEGQRDLLGTSFTSTTLALVEYLREAGEFATGLVAMVAGEASDWVDMVVGHPIVSAAVCVALLFLSLAPALDSQRKTMRKGLSRRSLPSTPIRMGALWFAVAMVIVAKLSVLDLPALRVSNALSRKLTCLTPFNVAQESQRPRVGQLWTDMVCLRSEPGKAKDLKAAGCDCRGVEVHERALRRGFLLNLLACVLIVCWLVAALEARPPVTVPGQSPFLLWGFRSLAFAGIVLTTVSLPYYYGRVNHPTRVPRVSIPDAKEDAYLLSNQASERWLFRPEVGFLKLENVDHVSQQEDEILWSRLTNEVAIGDPAPLGGKP